MPPKARISREKILAVAVDLVRSKGAQAINARNMASALDCSTQPIFSNFATMDQLRLAVMEEAQTLYKEYTRREIEKEEFPFYKANGMAYIRFAKEEKQLFQLLFMCDRSEKSVPKDSESFSQMQHTVGQNLGLAPSDAQLFHLEMWAYVHGIATMFATGYLNPDWELVSKMLTDAYRGLTKQFEREEKTWMPSEPKD